MNTLETPDGLALLISAEVSGIVSCADPCVPECPRHGQTEGES